MKKITPTIETGINSVEPAPASKRIKNINRIIYFALAVIAISLGIFAYWSVQSTDVITVRQNPLPERTIREHPTAGGVVILTADFCKNVDVTGTLRLSYVSQTREIFVPIGKEQSPKGCHKADFPVLIPNGIQPDTYRIKFRATYDINPLKKGIVQEFYSKPVIVVSPDDPTATIVPQTTTTQ